VGLIFMIGAWGAYLTDSRIQNSGASAQGHLERKVFLFDAGGDSEYLLEYWFLLEDGSRINASHHVSKALWDAVHENQTIEIKYSASKPQRNFPLGAGVTSLGMTIFASLFGAVFALFGGALIWGYFRHSSANT